MQSEIASESHFSQPLNCMEVRGGHGSASEFFHRPGLDVWIWSQARQAAETGGGDVHFITSCASGRITRTLIGEIGGVGEMYSHVSAAMRGLMKRFINVLPQSSAERLLSATLAGASAQGGFASILLSTFFAPTCSMTICNAGHPPPLLYKAASKTWTMLKVDQTKRGHEILPTGAVCSEEYQKFKLSLEVGDMLLSFSNSLAECKQADGRTLGMLGIQRFAQRLNQSTASRSILVDLVDGIKQEHPDNLCNEDLTVILSKVTRTRVPLRDNFLAPLRLFRPVRDRTLP